MRTVNRISEINEALLKRAWGVYKCEFESDLEYHILESKGEVVQLERLEAAEKEGDPYASNELYAFLGHQYDDYGCLHYFIFKEKKWLRDPVELIHSEEMMRIRNEDWTEEEDEPKFLSIFDPL